MLLSSKNIFEPFNKSGVKNSILSSENKKEIFSSWVLTTNSEQKSSSKGSGFFLIVSFSQDGRKGKNKKITADKIKAKGFKKTTPFIYRSFSASIFPTSMGMSEGKNENSLNFSFKESAASP